jgi:RNA polymerase sigma-32 factor
VTDNELENGPDEPVIDGEPVEIVEVPTAGVSGLPVKAGSEDQSVQVDLLYRYIRDIQRYPLLTPDEEQDLTRKYVETGDPEIAYHLVSANLRLVIKIAMEYRTFTSQVLDLIQEGNIGLVKAVQHFDPLKGVRLSHYAQYWIRSYIIYYLLNNHRMVKLGTTQAQRKVFFNLRKERQRLLNMGYDPTARMIATNLSVPESTVNEMIQRMDAPDLYLDAPHGTDGKTTYMSSMAGDTDIEAEASAREISERVRTVVAAFGKQLDSERDIYIWQNRLLSDDPVTLQSVGDKFGVSRERARQIEERIKRRFKEYLQKELGDDFVQAQILSD